DDIATIQEKIGIVGYTNQEMAEKADKNVRVYLRKFEEFHGPLENVPSVLIQKFINNGVKKFWFTGEGLQLFPNISPQQLHEIFVKKSAINSVDTIIAEIRSVTVNVLVKTILLGPPVKIMLRDTLNGSGTSGGRSESENSSSE
ncbi:10653_t:CDS:2, partial [Entrophospora sp. SA101]